MRLVAEPTRRPTAATATPNHPPVGGGRHLPTTTSRITSHAYQRSPPLSSSAADGRRAGQHRIEAGDGRDPNASPPDPTIRGARCPALALFACAETRGTARDLAGRFLAHGTSVVWYHCDARGRVTPADTRAWGTFRTAFSHAAGGTHAVEATGHRAPRSASELAAVLSGVASSVQVHAAAVPPSAVASSPAASSLFGKGQAAATMGDRARAAEAFAAARDAAGRATSGRHGSPPTHDAFRYFPVIVTLLADEASLSSVLSILDAPALPHEMTGSFRHVSDTSALLVNLGAVSEACATATRARCAEAGAAYVQAALLGSSSSSGAQTLSASKYPPSVFVETAWAASGDGVEALAAAEACVLGPATDWRGGSVKLLDGGDPRDAASPFAAARSELLREQAAALEEAAVVAESAAALEEEAMSARRHLDAARDAAEETAGFVAEALDAARTERERHAEACRHLVAERDAAARDAERARAAAAISAAALDAERGAR